MSSVRITFDKVNLTSHKSVRCSGGCGRMLRRQKQFWKTVNPFNKNEDGTLKSRVQISEELQLEARAWQELPETCAHCGPQEAA